MPTHLRFLGFEDESGSRQVAQKLLACFWAQVFAMYDSLLHSTVQQAVSPAFDAVAGHSWWGCVMMHVADKLTVGFAFLTTQGCIECILYCQALSAQKSHPTSELCPTITSQ